MMPGEPLLQGLNQGFPGLNVVTISPIQGSNNQFKGSGWQR